MTSTREPVVTLLRDAARARKLRQVRLADLASISPGHLGQVLGGHTPGSPALLCRLAQLTGVTADQLREAGRPDVAVLVEASPTLSQATVEQLVAELGRRVPAP